MATKETYTEGVGRRKTASARVRITPAKSEEFMVNGKPLADYFVIPRVADTAREVLKDAGGTFSVSVHVMGSGLKAQAEAVRHGLARALVKHNAELRPQVKQAGYLTRDSRMVERKKFGLRGARRRPQWSKR